MGNVPSGPRANAAQPSPVAEKSSAQTIHINNSRVDTRNLETVQGKLNTGRKEAGKAVASKEKKPGLFSSFIRNIKALVSFFSSSSNPAKASSSARANPEVRKQEEAGAEAPKKPPFKWQLGDLPFDTWNVQPQDDFQLSPDDEKNLADGFIDNRKELDRRVDSSPLKMTPRSCLAGVLLISGVFKAPDQFKDEFNQASAWKQHTSVRGAWRSLAGFGIPENSVLNATTIKVRINLCRMTAERVSPEFLEKFDKAAKILSKQDDGTWSHGVTKENYWEVITAIQTLAWNELKGSAS